MKTLSRADRSKLVRLAPFCTFAHARTVTRCRDGASETLDSVLGDRSCSQVPA
jgi:hypothetical protein